MTFEESGVKDISRDDPMRELIKHKIGHPFARSLSTVESYHHMKEENKISDYSFKIVLVGDNGVGKTSLLMSYIERKFPEKDELPTVFVNSNFKKDGPNGKNVELALWDTASHESYNRLRPLSYTNADLLMVCYAINDGDSLQHVEDRWFPEVKHFCYDTPIMLVGLKSDLYNDVGIGNNKRNALLDAEKVDKKAESLGAVLHMQCSAKTLKNVDDLFQTTMVILLDDQPASTKPSVDNGTRKSLSLGEAKNKLYTKNLKRIKQNNCTIT